MKTMKRLWSFALCMALALACLPHAAALAATEQFSLPAGGTYYFDLSGENIPGSIDAYLPDSSLHYVPFTYVGTINAYSLSSSSSGQTGASAAATASDRSLFVSEHNIHFNLSWDMLHAENLIFGKTFDTNYTLRSLSMGNDATGSGDAERGTPETNEWDSVLNKNASYIKNWTSLYSIGQDTGNASSDDRAIRGYSSSRRFAVCINSNKTDFFAFRPALEVQNPAALGSDGLKGVTLKLNSGKLNGSTADINIICAGSSFQAPSGTGLTRPSGVAGNYFKWNTAQYGTGTSYDAGAVVPNTVTTLYAQWAVYNAYNTPAAIAQNGVTATVTFDKLSPQAATTSVTATVTLSGTATAAGTHTINLTSNKASLNGTAQTATVTAGQNLTTTPVTKTFTFTMPAADVDDLTLTHTFTVTPIISFTAQPVANTHVMAGSITGTLTATAAVFPSGMATLNWYACDAYGTPSGNSLGTGGTFTIPTTLTAGVHYYLCLATAQGAAAVSSNVATVAVNAAPNPVISINPSATFQQGSAPITTITIGEGLVDFNATNNFDSAAMDGSPLAIGVSTVQVRDGSIILQFNPLYLNTLSVGTHTVTVTLKGGAYAGRTVSTTLTVTQAAPVVTPPKTGDSATPMLWLGLMLLGGAGLAMLWLKRKQRV